MVMPSLVPMLAQVADDSGENYARVSFGANAAVEARTSRMRVLVVDDQRLIADTLAEILVNAGFESAAAYDGGQALSIAPQFRPDCLVSDVLMPGMNGVELAIAIRQMYPGINILLFSGQAGISEVLQDGRRRGYEFELIAKPIHPLNLIERLRNSS